MLRPLNGTSDHPPRGEGESKSYAPRPKRWEAIGLLLLLLVSTQAVPACPIHYATGDPIGVDSSLTDNTGGFTAALNNGANLGQPAILVSLTGQEVLTELRVIVFGLPAADGTLRFDHFDYRLDLWRSADYFAGRDPQLRYDLGDPVGVHLVEEEPTRVVPDPPFGTAGAGGGNAATYDFRFNLTQLPSELFSEEPSLQTLPASDWVLGFQSWHDPAKSGSLRVAGATAPEGPLPLFSRDAVDRGILGGQSPDEIVLYWGMSLGVVPAIQTTDGGDLNLDGIVDAADYTVWRDGLAGSYEISDYQCWRTNFGVSPSLNGPPGDFNAGGVVDAADYTVWRDNLGNGSESVLNSAGNGVNGVDPGDYDLWRQEFGSLNAISSGNHSVVPEPSGLVLLFGTGLIMCHKRNRSQSITLD